MPDLENEQIDFDSLDPSPSTPQCEFITGVAGSGKSFTIRKRVDDDPSYAILSSSTGISAVNLGCTTINSLLGFYDTDSLRDAFIRGSIQSKLRKIVNSGVKNIVLDECSMVSKENIDMIYSAIAEVNGYKTTENPIGLICVGDLCQLPPIKAEWIFRADCWPYFQSNTTKLTKVWRQSHPDFLAALNFLRRGEGRNASDILSTLTPFQSKIDNHFEGTTILGRNDEVDRFNSIRLQELKGEVISVLSKRWGKQSAEWKKNIPERLQLKIGAYVYILNNDSSGGAFTYVNGDAGTIEDFDGRTFSIKLVRNGAIVRISPIHRTVTQRDEPSDLIESEIHFYDGGLPPFGKVSFDENKELYHMGGILFYPLKLAWASTCHRSQGLSLDKVQVDVRHPFFGSPAMAYVAISRVREPEGLRLVGSAEKLIKNCNVHPEVIDYL